MSRTAVADTGPLLHLTEIGQENLLTGFDLVTISEQVVMELKRHGIFVHVSVILCDCLTIEVVTQLELDRQWADLSKFRIHEADLSVAVLAARLVPEIVLTDDLELRKGLETQGCSVVGSVGVLFRSFKAGHLTKLELQKCFDQLFDGSTLYLSKGFRVYIHKLLDNLAGENADTI